MVHDNCFSFQDIRTQADSKEILEDINTEIRGKVRKLRKKIEVH